jgi:Replication-relaxation
MRRSRGLYAEGHEPKEGEACAQIMVRAERNVSRARASPIDERDLQVLLHLLEHKILTTHQISSLCFRSLRRCQHRMRELKEMGLVSTFSVGRGFGEGRAPACWHLTKPGLVEIADAKDVRTSDLPWVPDSSYRTSKMIAHRLGVNAFFCALAEASKATQGHCLATWRPEHWVRTKAAEVKPDGFGRHLHPGGACEFYLEYDRATEAFGAHAQARGLPEARSGMVEGAGAHRIPEPARPGPRGGA